MTATLPTPILLVSDSPPLVRSCTDRLARSGFAAEVLSTSGGTRIAEAAMARPVVILDGSCYPPLAFLSDLRAAGSSPPVVVLSSNASLAFAVEVMRWGAADFLPLPFDGDRLITSITRCLGSSCAEKPAPAGPPSVTPELIGESRAMAEVFTRIQSMAKSKAPVFITGETGTGKELAAEAIHRRGHRANKPFIPLNCGAIPRDLMESEIFGHLKGSFTGAIADRIGAAGIADGGTLFLDEICEMHPDLQIKLLRFLQSGRIQRVGSAAAEPVDVRIICATNRDPAEEVVAGRFRKDLFYRLHVLALTMPALRERDGDVLILARRFLAAYAAEEAKTLSRLSSTCEAALLAYGWPGNIRELQNVIRRAVVLNDAEELEADMLGFPPACGIPQGISALPRPDADGITDLRRIHAAMALPASFFTRQLWQIEREVIEGALSACNGSIPQAARILGVSPSTLYRKRETWDAPSKH
ncbi:MAG: sigma-54-dependent transcriptional regulator [Aestuariivirgaceae bacterium]